MELTLKVLGTPLSKQSARFRAVNIGGKTTVRSYQKKSVTDSERNIAFDIKSQLPPDFKPFDVPISIDVAFVFPPLKTWNKKQKQALKDGTIIYKDKKPDLNDNLMKGVCDAMNGIVYTDDARICKVDSVKVFGEVPMIEMTIKEL